jgi:hypothetical protein
MKALIPVEVIERRILLIRGHNGIPGAQEAPNWIPR